VSAMNFIGRAQQMGGSATSSRLTSRMLGRPLLKRTSPRAHPGSTTLSLKPL
jgi:hypothetical protein